MSREVLSTFESSLQGSATVERVDVDGFATVLDDHVDPPAIGAELPFEGVTLAGIDVETDFAPSDLHRANTGVTPGGVGIADYGTVTVQARRERDELVALYPERHVRVVRESDVVPDMAAAFERFGEDFAEGLDTQVMETGPSSTADLGSLIEGVHGPREVHVLVLEGR